MYCMFWKMFYVVLPALARKLLKGANCDISKSSGNKLESKKQVDAQQVGANDGTAIRVDDDFDIDDIEELIR